MSKPADAGGEDEWEIIAPLGPSIATFGGAVDACANAERCEEAQPEVPEELIKGCLDPECDAQFGDLFERRRCGFCRLSYCDRHLVTVGVAGTVVRPSSLAGQPARTCRQMEPLTIAEAAFDALAFAAPGAVALCNECLTALSPAPLLAPQEPVAEDDGFAAPEPKLVSPAVDVIDRTSISLEMQLLIACGLQDLKTWSEQRAEPANRYIGRMLMLRLLERLRTCLRPWANVERAWIWSLKEELVEDQRGWFGQLARQDSWDSYEAAKGLASLIERGHAQRRLGAREAVQVLGALGRRASVATAVLGERRLGLLATKAAEAVSTLAPSELACCLELLLDAAEALGNAGATGGRRAVVGMLVKMGTGPVSRPPSPALGPKDDAAFLDGAEEPQQFDGPTMWFAKKGGGGGPRVAALRGELFWALEARAVAAGHNTLATLPPSAEWLAADSRASWPPLALEELLQKVPHKIELELMRQRSWVRRLERGEFDAARTEPGPWGDSRGFPLVVWPPNKLCLGIEGMPKRTTSKCAPVIVRCSCKDAPGGGIARHLSSSSVSPYATADGVSDDPTMAIVSAARPFGETAPAARTTTAGLLLKRDAGMHREQQVSQTLRLLERLIWEDERLLEVLSRLGMKPEDVKATYAIAMTGPGTAIVEFVEGADTLKNVRSRGKNGGRGTLLEFLREQNSPKDLGGALARLACTSAISAVLSFVAGLGDRHHENFMVAGDGRLLHVDYGYALGQEPLDSVLIHFAVQGGRPIATLQYEELYEALGPELVRLVFWPVVRAAYLRVRHHAGLLAEMVHAAVMKDVRVPQQQWKEPTIVQRHLHAQAVARAWETAQAFVAHRCAIGLSEPCAERFISSLLWYCARHERGTRLRDELKRLGLQAWPAQAASKAYTGARAATRVASAAAVSAATAVRDGVSSAATGNSSAKSVQIARGVAKGLYSGVRDLMKETKK